MAFDSLLSLISPPAVHAKPDVSRVNPDGQNRQEGRGRKKHEGQEEGKATQPVPNTLGEITGKLIDTTA